MIRLKIDPSPSPDVLLERYDAALFPEFDRVFERPGSSFLPPPMLMDPEEASSAVVLQNQGDKAITALKHRWQFVDESGRQRNWVKASDSYTGALFRVIAAPRARQLISLSNRVDKDLIDQIAAGGGSGIFAGGSRSRPAGVDEYTFAIDLIVFEDGEIAGSDPDKFASELRARKPAAEFVAAQIRLADAEGRDVTPVLLALSQIPSLGMIGHAQGDPLVHCTRFFAEKYLHAGKLGGRDHRTGVLNWFENIPAVPNFYVRPK